MSQSKRPNVLFIFVDDLRPELGCYGNKFVRSPNIDQLASSAVTFKNQFVTVPTCGASRASILTGVLPRSVKDLSNEAMRSKNAARTETSSESFIHELRKYGYYTVGIGKVSHSPDGYVYNYQEPRSNRLELPLSWDEVLFNAGKWGTGWNAFFGYADGSNRNSRRNMVRPYEKADSNDDAYVDGLTAGLAAKKLKALSRSDQPFFLGVGFFKPHLPFNAPAKYWDMYTESNIELSPSPLIPLYTDERSLHGSDEFNAYKAGEEKASLKHSLSDQYARKLRHGYYASISYVDAQIGKVLTALKRSGLDKNTIVVLWGDHGWHLGDQRVWGKHTLSDWSLRSPLIIKMPDERQGASCEKVISAVDIYPTLMELCGLKIPAGLDGRSLVPLLEDPDRALWQNIAYSYFRQGISLRTADYRLTRYFRDNSMFNELFSYKTDGLERENIASQSPELIDRLMPLWESGNTGLYKTLDNKASRIPEIK